MSDSDQRHKCFGSVVRILLAIVLLTVTMTFVWILSGWETAKGSIYHSDGGIISVSNMTRVTREQERAWTATPVIIQELTQEQAPGHRLHAEQIRVKPRSRNDGDVIQDNQFEIESSMYKNRAPMLVIREQFMKKMPYSSYYRGNNTSSVVDENPNDGADTPRIFHAMNIRRLNHKQINNYGYPIIQINEPIVDKDVLNNNQNAYDLTYDVNEKGSEETKKSIDRSGWTTFFNGSGQIIPGGLWLSETPERSGSFPDQPHFRLEPHYQNKKGLEYRLRHDANRNPKIPEGQLLKHFPPTHKIDIKTQPFLDTQQNSLFLQPPGIPAIQNNISSSPQKTITEIPVMNEIIWRRISLMAFIKLGLITLKAIGFIKILFLSLFKLKFVLIVLFFKFFSLFKFIKFSILPLFILPLVTIFFHTTMKTSPAYTLLMNILDTNKNPGIFSTANPPIPNTEEVTNSPLMFFPETVRVPEEPMLVPGETIFVPGETILVPSGQTVLVPSGQTAPTIPGQNLPNFNIPPDVTNAFNAIGQRYEPLEVIDPTLDFFQMELNSEKCVERIACKIAVTGKTGIIPLWINWVLHRVSKPVPNDTLLYYLKAYDDVINEINMKSPNPDNWETWCSERYKCNNKNTR